MEHPLLPIVSLQYRERNPCLAISSVPDVLSLFPSPSPETHGLYAFWGHRLYLLGVCLAGGNRNLTHSGLNKQRFNSPLKGSPERTGRLMQQLREGLKACHPVSSSTTIFTIQTATSQSLGGCGAPGEPRGREQRKDCSICVAPSVWKKQKLSQNL